MSQSKRMRFQSGSAALRHASEIIQSVENDERVEELPLRLIELDPDNRPLTKLRLDDPRRIDPNDPHAVLKREFLQGLEELADSIRVKGRVEQPIKVYKRGSMYRVIFGERRVLASVLADMETVRAIVVPEPADLRRMQMFENSQRENPLAWEAILNIRGFMEEEAKQGRAINDYKELSKAIKKSEAQANKLWALLHAPKDITEAMRDGKIKGVQQAYEISTLDDIGTRKAAIEAAAVGGSVQAVKAVARRASARNEKRRGRKRTAISLGRTENVGLVKRILKAVGKPEQLRGIDWDNVDQVQRVWNEFLKAS